MMLFTGSIARSAKARYLSYSEADFEVFRSAGATRCIDGVQFGVEERTFGLPCSTFPDCYPDWRHHKMSKYRPKTAKSGFFAARGRQNKPIETKFGRFAFTVGCSSTLNLALIGKRGLAQEPPKVKM